MEEIAIGELLARLMRSPALRHIAIGAGVAVALVVAWFVFWGWIAHREHAAADAARAALQAEITAATAAESARRDAEIADANAKRDAAAAAARTERNRNAILVSSISRLSARNDALPCLDRAAARRLRRLIDSGRQSGDGAAEGSGGVDR